MRCPNGPGPKGKCGETINVSLNSGLLVVLVDVYYVVKSITYSAGGVLRISLLCLVLV